MRKIAFSLMLIVLWPLCLFAAPEDWNGTFVIRDEQGVRHTIIHSPKNAQALSMSARNCINLSKGTTINGLKIKEDVSLCTKAPVEQFTTEVKKLGFIEAEKVVPGPTYSS